MGILDDAIREHLELKRRRGADASEIARLEKEALGPVRREPFTPMSHESASPDEVEERSVSDEGTSELSEPEFEEYYEGDHHDEEAGDDWGAPFDDDLKRPRGSPSQADAPQPATDDQEGESAPGRGSRLWRRARRRSIPPEDAPPTQGEAPVDMPPDEETGEYRVDDAAATRGRRGDEPVDSEHSVPDDEGNVLEETPEFLQDAPEHDRLWFEQRPPRDFDFDD